ncbi:MAG: BON domain-containing protein [Ardenticatenaceae bacterium]|nr:BON domain-containing protein [Ardenticatenaceae bacterium]
MIPGPYTGVGPRGYQRSDERIREEVYKRLTHFGYLDASDIEVSVENGEVTLTGGVGSRRGKRLAEDVVESIPGVRDIHNRLRVKLPYWKRVTKEPDAIADEVAGDGTGAVIGGIAGAAVGGPLGAVVGVAVGGAIGAAVTEEAEGRGREEPGPDEGASESTGATSGGRRTE